MLPGLHAGPVCLYQIDPQGYCFNSKNSETHLHYPELPHSMACSDYHED